MWVQYFLLRIGTTIEYKVLHTGKLFFYDDKNMENL